MDPYETLNKAADLLEKKGHTKFTRQDENGMCILGALLAAKKLNPFSASGQVLTEMALVYDNLRFTTVPDSDDNNAYGHCYAKLCEVVFWNNADARTGQDVINALRETAKGLLSPKQEVDYLEITRNSVSR